MKKHLVKLQKLTIICTVLLTMICMFTIGAGAKNIVNINGIQFEHNDTVTYVAELKCGKIYGGINATLTYDASALEIIGESVNVPNLGLTAANYDNPGSVRFAGIDTNGFDFSNAKVLISVSFKIKSSVDSNISIKLDEIYDNDLTELNASEYQITEKISKGEFQGEIVDPNNYDDLKDASGNPVDIPKIESSQPKPADTNNLPIFIILGVAVVVVGVVAVVYLKKVKSKNNN